MEERNRLYDLREAHLQVLNHDIEIINDDDHFYSLTLSDLELYKSRMGAAFREMEIAHHQYRQLAMVASNDILRTTEADLLSAFAKMQPRIQVLASTAHSRPHSPLLRSTFGQFAASATANSTVNPDSQPVIRVEQPHRPQVGKFNGSMADWPAFRDLFVSEVHNRPIDAVRKLLLLKDACVGKAAETLGTWQPTADNYQLAWDTMMSVYNDEYHIVHGILAKLHSTGKQSEESHDAIRTILDSLNSCTRQLQRIATPEALTEQIWIHHGKQRLPHKTLDAWEQHRNQSASGNLPTFDEFKRFLDSRAKARREFENQGTLVQHDGGHKVKQELRAKGESSQNRSRPYDKGTRGQPATGTVGDRYGFAPATECIMPGCGQVHYLGQCRHFANLTLKDRLQKVQEKRLCKCCLTSGHMAAKCNRSGCSKCPNERIKHHFRLCQKISDVRPTMSSDIKPPEP